MEPAMTKKRTDQLARIAFELEMEFLYKDQWGLLKLLKDFSLFRKGHSKRIYNVLHKQDEWLNVDIRVFDYRFVIGAGNNQRILKQTVFFMQSKFLGLPQFLMKPENFFHKIGQFLGIEDIDFEKFPVFSNQYWLKGEDKDFIRASMNEEVLKFFTIEKNWSLEGVNYYLIFYRKDKLLPPAQIVDFYKKGMHICEMLKIEREENPPA